LKVAFIHPSNPLKERTGATYSANKIIEELVDRDHEITVYCVNKIEESENLSYKTENLITGDKTYKSRTSRLNEEIIDRKEEFEKFDIIYSYRLDNLLALGKIRKEISTKIVVTLNSYGGICPTHTLMYRDKHPISGDYRCLKCIMQQTIQEINDKDLKHMIKIPRHVMRRLIRLRRIRKASKVVKNIDRFHAVSEHVKDRYVDAGYSEEKIKVTPSIIDEKFLIEHNSDFEQPYNLLFVGYLKKHKGADIIIPIIEELNRKTDKEFKLTIVGSGPLKEKIEKQTKNSPASNKIEFRGRVPNPELPEIYASHDLLINPVKWEEPWGRVFLESLSAGTPIISNNIENAKTLKGVETAENNAEKFAEKIAEILNKQRLEKLSKEGKKQMNKYLPEETVDNIEKSMEEIINKEA